MTRHKYYACDKCQGSGKIVVTILKSTPKTNYKNEIVCYCHHCWGVGKFDWIQNIRRPKPMKKFCTDNILNKYLIEEENIVNVRPYIPLWRCFYANMPGMHYCTKGIISQ